MEIRGIFVRYLVGQVIDSPKLGFLMWDFRRYREEAAQLKANFYNLFKIDKELHARTRKAQQTASTNALFRFYLLHSFTSD